MNGHQRLEQFSMVGYSQVQQFMRDDKVLKPRFLFSQALQRREAGRFVVLECLNNLFSAPSISL